MDAPLTPHQANNIIRFWEAIWLCGQFDTKLERRGYDSWQQDDERPLWVWSDWNEDEALDFYRAVRGKLYDELPTHFNALLLDTANRAFVGSMGAFPFYLTCNH